MAIRKSKDLQDKLLKWNFHILWLDLNVGDWIESAIDWVVDWLNAILWQAEATEKKADSVTEDVRRLTSTVHKLEVPDEQKLKGEIKLGDEAVSKEAQAYRHKSLVELGALEAELKATKETLEAEIRAYRHKGIENETAIKELISEINLIDNRLTEVRDVIRTEQKEKEGIWERLFDFMAHPVEFFVTHMLTSVIESFTSGFEKGMKED